MPNLAFHLEVLDQAIQRLVSKNDSRGKIMAKHKKFAALGALGPDLLRYLPVSEAISTKLAELASDPPDELDADTLFNIFGFGLFELFEKPLGATYSILFRQLVVPIWPVLNEIKNFLDKMDAIALTENKFALPPMISQANGLVTKATSLQSQVETIENSIPAAAGLAILPPWMHQDFFVEENQGRRQRNRLFEFLRWHYPSDFARNLLVKASTNQQKAYAFGYLSHVTASVTGEPFINNITGGPYRTHWWRNGLVRNYVDSWTYGFFKSKAKMKGDEPLPRYAAWRSLCSANLQEQFNVAGLGGAKSFGVPEAVKAMATGKLDNLPNQFPDDLAQMLKQAVDLTYPTNQPDAGFTADKFKEGFVGAFAVYWFMTSGSGPMCDNPLGPPPDNCTKPSWVEPLTAPSPQEAGLNTAGANCAKNLAILALLLILTGNVSAGITALIVALNVPIIDWDKVRCNLFWLRKTIVDLENGVRDMLIGYGLAYPPSHKLGTTDVDGNTQPAVDGTPGAGVPLCRSNNLEVVLSYPKTMDSTSPDPDMQLPDLNFASYPIVPVPVETLPTQTLILPDQYPNFVVNGPGLLNGGVLNDQPPGGSPSSDTFFGDAVSNAVEVIRADGVNLQNYNLDADRGYGWKSWTPPQTTAEGPLTLPLLYDLE